MLFIITKMISFIYLLL